MGRHPAVVPTGEPEGRSLWLREALTGSDVEVAPRLEADVRADVCIVGGGYTGLWTALRLKELESSRDVILIEADVCGGGASGRNGGFVLSWWVKFHTMAKLFGADEALRLGRSSADAIGAIARFCDTNGIDARLHGDGYLWAATNMAQVGAWRATMEELDRHGAHPFEEWSADQVARRAGSAMHEAGVFERTGAIVQPALLARGLRRVAGERGVRIHEGTPMVRLVRPGGRGNRPRVVTPRGTVTADVVVVAMNAWAARFREVRRRVVVLGSDIVVTPPIPGRLAEIGWVDGLAISDSRLLVHYYRTTDDGRVAFGKGGGALAFGKRVGRRFEGVSPRAGEVTQQFHRLYPLLADVPAPVSWTGPIDRSRTGLPFFAPLGGRPDVLVGVGYSGNGVGPSYLGGRILASLAIGRDDADSASPLVGTPDGRFPPEPFRFAGGHLVRAAIARKERAEDEGRPVGPLTMRLVRLAPAGLVPVKGG